MRKNKFKKSFISQDTLIEIYPELSIHLSSLKERYNRGHVKDYEFCAEYLWIFFKNLNSKSIKNKDFDFKNFQKTQIKNLPHFAKHAILKWSEGLYSLKLFFDIPKFEDVLKLQSQGHRCVTAICDSRIKYSIEHDRDALSFLIHDLIHAYHFWENEVLCNAQIFIYDWIYRNHKKDSFKELLQDSVFKKQFEYLASDMNSHPIHILKTLKFSIDDYFNRHQKCKDSFLDLILEDFFSEFKLLNTEKENALVLERIFKNLVYKSSNYFFSERTQPLATENKKNISAPNTP